MSNNRRRQQWWAGPAGWIIPVTVCALVLLGLGAMALSQSDDPNDTGETPVLLDRGEAVSSSVTCDSLVGRSTADVLAAGECDDNGEPTVFGVTTYDCPDGRQLHTTNMGWGYSDSTWQPGQPAQADLDTCT